MEARTSGTTDDNRTPTINDVASMAGVSASTVSRVFTHPDRVRIGTSERVQQLAKSMGYTPRRPSSHSAPARIPLLGIIVPEIGDPFFLELIKETQIQFRVFGRGQLVVDTDDSPTTEAETIRRLRGTVDGLILAASRLSDADLLDAAGSIPLIAINRDAPNVPCLIVDNVTGSLRALDHLVSLGHTRIAYIGGNAVSWSNQRRLKALTEHAEESGITLTAIGGFPARMSSGAVAADMSIRAGVTAAICIGDLIAIGMIQRLKQRGISVPEKFSVVGSDDIFGAAFCSPPLTTITPPTTHIAQAATRMLLKQMSSQRAVGPPAHIVVPTHLTIRSSTAPPDTSA